MRENKAVSAIVVILTIALIARVLLLLGIVLKHPDGFFQVDSYGYWQIAENIINHGSFSQSTAQPLIPDHSRTPLYPLFMSLLRYIGLGATGIIFIQILLSSATCLIVILLTYKLIGSWKPACLAGGILAIDVPSIVLSNSLLTETLFTFLLTLSVLYLVLYFKRPERVSALLSSGVLMGLCVLCRPIAIFLPAFIIIVFFLSRNLTRSRMLLGTTLYLTCCFLSTSPWLIRNHLVFGSKFISTIRHTDVLYNRAAGIHAITEGTSLPEAQGTLRGKAISTFQGDIEKEPIEYKKFEARMGASIILSHPAIYIRNHILSVFNMLFKPIRSAIDLQLGFSKSGTTLTIWGEKYNSSLYSRLLQKTSMFTIIVVIIQILMLIILWISFIYGIARLLAKKEYFGFSIIVLLIAYFCIMSGGPEAYARFRVPILPFLSVAAAVGIANVHDRLKIKT